MNTKQVIVIRKDLNMRKGKIAAQAAHASMKALLDLGIKDKAGIRIPFINDAMIEWLNGAFKKICVYVNSEEKLINLYNKAEEKRLIRSIIIDNGLTEFHGVPTKTCIAIGPECSEVLDEITGDLPLF